MAQEYTTFTKEQIYDFETQAFNVCNQIHQMSSDIEDITQEQWNAVRKNIYNTLMQYYREVPDGK